MKTSAGKVGEIGRVSRGQQYREVECLMVSKSKMKRLEKKLLEPETSEFRGVENPKEILLEKINKMANRLDGDPVECSDEEVQEIINRLKERANRSLGK